MTASSSLVPYRAGPTTTITSRSYSASMVSSQLFSQQTGAVIATELLYRILFDIINRFLNHFQRLAARGIDEASTWLERKVQERRERKAATTESATSGLGIMNEVEKLAEQRGFILCPMTGQQMDVRMDGKKGPPGPPMWVRGVLQGIDEGRMVDRDFWIHTHGD